MTMVKVTRMRAHKPGGRPLELPSRGSESAAGLDLRTAQGFVLYPGERHSTPTGFAVAIPETYVGIIKPRSGLAVRHGIDVLAGVIDSDYRGEVKVMLINHGEKYVVFDPGDRVAQLLVIPCWRGLVEEVAVLDDTQRGDNGFGSTGVK